MEETMDVELNPLKKKYEEPLTPLENQKHPFKKQKKDHPSFDMQEDTKQKIINVMGWNEKETEVFVLLNHSLRDPHFKKSEHYLNHDDKENLDTHLTNYTDVRPEKVLNKEYYSDQTIDPATLRIMGATRQKLKAIEKKGVALNSPHKKSYVPPQTFLTDDEAQEKKLAVRKLMFEVNSKKSGTTESTYKTLLSIETEVLTPFCAFMKTQKESISKPGSNMPFLDAKAIGYAFYKCIKTYVKNGQMGYFIRKESGYLCFYFKGIKLGWVNVKGDDNNNILGKNENPVDESGVSTEWHHLLRSDAGTEKYMYTIWYQNYEKIKDKLHTLPLKELCMLLCPMVLLTKKGHDLKDLHPNEKFCSLPFAVDRLIFAGERKGMNGDLQSELQETLVVIEPPL